MTMKDESRYLKTIDFFMVEEKHEAIHARLENWARYVAVKRPAWGMQPMFRQYRSKAWQWHIPELKVPADSLDGHRIEKTVSALPEPFRGVLRWAYVYKFNARQAARNFALTEPALWEALSRGRAMVKNTL